SPSVGPGRGCECVGPLYSELLTAYCFQRRDRSCAPGDEMADLFELLTGPALRTVALGSTVLGVVSGALSSFAVLRRQSLVGDAISHAALPGIAAAFLLTRSKSVLVLVAGAAVAGWLATTVVRRTVRATRVPFDSALAGVLAVFFGFGLLLLTHIQRTGGG